jgi:ribosomal protein S18 acetylase RimI-like enzyme
MEMTYTIREAHWQDARELARLRWEYRAEDQPAQKFECFLGACEPWLRTAIKSRRWMIAVAASPDGSLCGCMYLQCVDKVPIPGAITRSWGYVTNAYVSAGQRGKGIGGGLLDLLVDLARTRGLEFLIVWPSVSAVSLYERAGFRPASEVHDRPDDHPPLELAL